MSETPDPIPGKEPEAPRGEPTASGEPPSDPPSSGSRTSLRESLRKAFGRSDSLTVEQQIKRRTFFSMTGFFILGAAGLKSWFWLKNRPLVQGAQGPLRKGLNADESVFRRTLSPNHLAPTFPKSVATTHVRRNGDAGMDIKNFDPAAWVLRVARASGGTLSISLDELRQLPKTEFAFEFKCIEGWSQISHWGGVKFSDFVNKYNLDQEKALKYVGLNTPDKEYYVGIDMPSALHPQTLLCYEMSGQPLPVEHGGPLRLIIPIKYGVKNLKRISNMYFSNERPPDYWFERGYDYYCGL
jgi:DMSO/TMAO reductase YedYZ molybdopterin-dependent catalytic subunit